MLGGAAKATKQINLPGAKSKAAIIIVVNLTFIIHNFI